MSLTTSSDAQVNTIAALLRMAGSCDGACTEDEVGFNKMDSGFGRSLVEQVADGGTLTDCQFHAAVKMLRRYKNTQLPDLWPAIEAEHAAYVDGFSQQAPPAPPRATPVGPQIRVEVEDDRLVVTSPFSFREAVKALPGRQWNDARKVWMLPASIHTAEALGRAARTAGLPIAGCREWDDLLDRARDAWRARQTKETAPEASLPQLPGTTDGWTHQRRAFAFGRQLPAVGLGMDMGTGKSRTAIGFLEDRGAYRVLVLCPVSVMRVWPSQFAQHASRSWHVEQAHGSSKARTKRLPAIMATASPDAPVCYVINYESAWRDPIDRALLDQDWDVVICDESHRIKAPGGRSSNFAHRVGKKAAHRLALTGTPMAHTPLDVYGQCRFLDEGVFGTSYYRFSHRYGLFGGYEGREFEGMDPEHLDEFTAKFAALWFTCKAEDVLDLPELHSISRSCSLEPSARRIYTTMEESFIADFSEVDDEQERAALIAANAAVRVLRLQQISCGSLPDPDTGEQVVVSTAKADLLRDVLADLPESEPVVVFARFSADLVAIRKAAVDLGRRYNEISGGSKDALGDDAKLVPGCQVVGVQIQSGGVGIDLTAAHVAVFYSVGYSLADYLQAQKRVHRPGQTRSTLYVHLLTEGTIDHVVYRALRAHENVVEAVLRAAKEGSLQ